MRKRYILLGTLLLICVVIAAVLASTPEGPPEQLAVAEAKPEGPAFTFVVFGDNRPNGADLAQPQTFKKILAKMGALNPAFAVNTGDCIYGSWNPLRVREQYEEYTETTKSLFKPKVHLALGNHEILGSPANQAFFAKELGALYYSFDYEDSHFIILNSEVVGQTARITGKQLDWLKEDLKKARAARHKFVFLHRPLYPVDGHLGKCLDKHPEDRNVLHSLFVRNRITVVFAGHEHLFHEQVKNGVRYIITGGGGAFLYPSIHGKGDFHHFVVVSAAGDKVEMKVVKPALRGKPEEVIPIDKKK